MLRTRLALVTLLAAALVVVASASAATPVLNGVDGPGFTITLKKGGKKVTSLKAGKVKIVIKDLSNIHNFHLTGPGVNKKTGVGAKGTFTWTVTLKKGTYKFICDPHAAIMKGSFKVT
jgi:plastocyanin